MAERLAGRGTRAPRPRVPEHAPSEGYFFPGEVAELLDCRQIDYHQLRRLFRLVRDQASEPVRERKWARYTLRDIACLRIALDLCGGSEALANGRRLQIAPLERACTALRGRGVENPLLDVSLHRDGRSILAEVDGLLFDPVTGQISLSESHLLVQQYLAASPTRVRKSERATLVSILRTEARHSPPKRSASKGRGTVAV